MLIDSLKATLSFVIVYLFDMLTYHPSSIKKRPHFAGPTCYVYFTDFYFASFSLIFPYRDTTYAFVL